jgi:integrase
VDVSESVIRVRRAVARSRSEGVLTKRPKSEAGVRDVTIPSHVLPFVREHLRTYVTGRDGLLFPSAGGQHLAPSAFYGRATVYAKDGSVKRNGWGWYRARQVADREDLRFHDLRHTGAVLAAQAGATLAELMERLGHSTPQAALRYQSVASGRQAVIADRLADIAKAGSW